MSGAMEDGSVCDHTSSSSSSSTSSVTLTHRALHNIPSLPSSTLLHKLDLTFNAITSLKGVGSCSNLKWLSVSQNKLTSLKGIEGLSKLFVLNASKNDLRTMDEVKSLTSLRALILNDNNISSICGLEQMKDLNTLVLSRNPISEIGESLAESKSIKKLSLSKCRLKSVASSLKFCTRLRELRLAHNEIERIPAELVWNRKLQIVDVGYNLIVTSSDIKTALGSLSALRNLNLGGNLVMEKPKVENQVRKLLPNLQIFNSKPVQRGEKDDRTRSGVRSGNRDGTRSDDAVGGVPVKEGSATIKRGREQSQCGGRPPERVKKYGDGPTVDDVDTPFIEFFMGGEERGGVRPGGSGRRERREMREKGVGDGFQFDLPPVIQVGLGGSSTWE